MFVCLDIDYWEKKYMELNEERDYLKDKIYEGNMFLKNMLFLLDIYLKFNQIITNICKLSVSQQLGLMK